MSKTDESFALTPCMLFRNTCNSHSNQNLELCLETCVYELGFYEHKHDHEHLPDGSIRRVDFSQRGDLIDGDSPF